jgi:hypothetical protein
MKATCSSETSVAFQRTTRRYITEDKFFNFRIDHAADAGLGTVYETFTDGSEIPYVVSPANSMDCISL